MKGPLRAECKLYRHSEEYRWKAHGTHRCQKTPQRPPGRGDAPCESGRGGCEWGWGGGLSPGKCSCICIWCGWRISKERPNTGCGNQSRGRIQQGPVKDWSAEGPAHAIWSQPDTNPMDCRSVQASLLVSSQRAYNKDHSSRSSSTICLHQRPGRPEPKWAQQDSRTGRWRGHMQNIKGDTGNSQSNATPGGERVPALPRHRVSRQIQTSIVVHSWQQSNLSEILGTHFDRIVTFRQTKQTKLRWLRWMSFWRSFTAHKHQLLLIGLDFIFWECCLQL